MSQFNRSSQSQQANSRLLERLGRNLGYKMDRVSALVVRLGDIGEADAVSEDLIVRLNALTNAADTMRKNPTDGRPDRLQLCLAEAERCITELAELSDVEGRLRRRINALDRKFYARSKDAIGLSFGSWKAVFDLGDYEQSMIYRAELEALIKKVEKEIQIDREQDAYVASVLNRLSDLRNGRRYARL